MILTKLKGKHYYLVYHSVGNWSVSISVDQTWYFCTMDVGSITVHCLGSGQISRSTGIWLSDLKIENTMRYIQSSFTLFEMIERNTNLNYEKFNVVESNKEILPRSCDIALI